MLSKEFDQRIADLATDTQLKYYKLHCEGHSPNKTAIQYGVDRGTVRRSLEFLEKKAVANYYMPPLTVNGAGAGRIVGKVTTQIAAGEIEREWVRSDVDAENILAQLKAAADVLGDGIRARSALVNLTADYQDDDLLVVYPLFDKHFGMLSWGKETGEPYNLAIAEETETREFKRLVASQRPASQAVVVLGGDYFTADDENQRTPAHHNKLDVDGRSLKVIEVGTRMALRYVEIALQKHSTVRVEIISGNHDPVLSRHLMVFLSLYYENNPRVVVKADRNLAFSYLKFGNSMIAFHHGDKMKHDRMYIVITTDMREEWANTRFCKVFSGHFHSAKVVDYGECSFESLRTTIPNEQYAHAAGYRSLRTSYAIMFHKEDGEIGRTTFNVRREDSNG
jgi:hypothetical protein